MSAKLNAKQVATIATRTAQNVENLGDTLALMTLSFKNNAVNRGVALPARQRVITKVLAGDYHRTPEFVQDTLRAGCGLTAAKWAPLFSAMRGSKADGELLAVIMADPFGEWEKARKAHIAEFGGLVAVKEVAEKSANKVFGSLTLHSATKAETKAKIEKACKDFADVYLVGAA
jgi:hypothetical protein